MSPFDEILSEYQKQPAPSLSSAFSANVFREIRLRQPAPQESFWDILVAGFFRPKLLAGGLVAVFVFGFAAPLVSVQPPQQDFEIFSPGSRKLPSGKIL